MSTSITTSDYAEEGFQPEDLPEDELTPEFVVALIDRILEFQDLLVGYSLHPYQLPLARRIIESVLINDGEEITAQAARQSGKSETVANTVATLMVLLPRLATMYPDLLGRFKDGLWVGLFAPVEGQVETLFSRVMTRLTSPRAVEILGDPEIDDEASKAGGVVRTIRLKKSGSFVSMMTANPKAKIESRTFHLVIIDECQGADDTIVAKSIGPMLAYHSGTLVKTGTPATNKNNFYRSIQRNKRRQTGRNSRQQHFEWDWKAVAKVNPNYGKFVQKEMLRIGEDSDEFAMSYQCRWILERGMFVTEGVMDHLADKCLLPGTEVLTLDRGWVPVEGVQEQEFVASMDPVTRVMSFQPVSDTLTYDFDGEVLEIGASDRSLHLTVTPNHNVWATTRKNPTLRKIKAKDLPATARIPQVARGYEESFPAVSVPPRTYRNRQGNYTLSPALYAAILGQWLADGSLVVNEEAGKYIIKVSASRADKVSRIQHLLDEAGIRWWAEGTGKKDICWASKDMALELLPLQGSKNKRIPQEMWRWPQKYLEGLWDGLVTHGDGYWSDGSRTSGVFTTTSQQLADDVAALAVRMGYRANTSFVAATSAYRVNLTNKQSDSYAPRRWVPYSGPIHCLTVPPHHTMLVRQSGRICWTGNSMETVKHWHKSPVVVGIDPARKLDSTVVTVVWVDWDRPDEFGYYDHRILNWLELQGEDWEQQYAEITEFLSNYDVLAVAVDANGVGDAVAQRLKVLLPRAEVVPLSSSLAEQSGRFKHLQALIQRQMIGWPGHAKARRLRAWKRFMQQMVDAERVYQGANFTVKAPDEAWAHDDYVDSLAIACSLTKEYVMPTVEVSASPFF